MALSRDAMSDTVRGQDVDPEPPTLDELRRAHDWRNEERADGRYIVDVCEQCGHEESAGSRGRSPDCEVREIPSTWVEYARHRGLIPETTGSKTDSMAGVPASVSEAGR